MAVFQALLRIAEIEAGARRSAFAMFDLAPVVGDLAELYGAVAEDRGMRLDLSCPVPLPVFGDRELIQQAVANLLDNAIKFSPDGGAIELEAACTDRLRIVVADHGPGIPAEDTTRATERFFRGETARHTPGSGLGLALVQAVAQLHGRQPAAGGQPARLARNPGPAAQLRRRPMMAPRRRCEMTSIPATVTSTIRIRNEVWRHSSTMIISER